MSEETTTPSTEETPSEAPATFNWVAGQDGWSERPSGPVDVVYTPDGWVLKES